MYTVKDLKDHFTDYLMSMDLEKMDMGSLNTYSYILKTLDEMEKPGYAETLSMAFGGLHGMKDAEVKTENG